MADRPTGSIDFPRHPRRPVRERVTRGLPSYRPVRSPLVSMGPSLAEEQRRRRYLRRGTVLTFGAIGALVLLVTVVAWLSGEDVEPVGAPTVMTSAPVHTGRPQPLALASIEGTCPAASDLCDKLTLKVPIARKGITAIGYQAMRDPHVLTLDPEGTRGNVSSVQRIFRRFLATEQPSKLRYFMIDDGAKPNIATIGAFPGSAVYAPVSGTVIAISDYVINDKAAGSVVQVQPLGDAETIVVLRNLDPDARLAVGQTVSVGTTLLGTVRDLSEVRDQPLARFTHDSGSGLEMYVRRIRPESMV